MFQLIIGYEETLPTYLISRSSYPYWVMEIIVQGEGSVAYGSKKHELKAGSVFSFGPGVEHEIRTDSDHPMKKYLFVRSQKELPKEWSLAGIGPGNCLKHKESGSLAGWCELMMKEAESGNQSSDELSLGLYDLLLKKLYSERGEIRAHSSRKLVEKALKLMEEDPSKYQSLTDLASELDVSNGYLCHAFQAHHQYPPYQVLIEKKMLLAFELLNTGRYSVSKVAKEVGFEDPFHFSKLFKSRFDYPPSALLMPIKAG